MSGALSEGDFSALVKRKRYAQTNTEFDYSKVAIHPVRTSFNERRLLETGDSRCVS